MAAGVYCNPQHLGGAGSASPSSIGASRFRSIEIGITEVHALAVYLRTLR